MNGYVDRFQGRLRHLVELIDARGLRYEMTLRDDYGYVLEMRMLGVVAFRQAPRLGAGFFLSFGREAGTSRRPSKNYARCVYARLARFA